MAKQAVQHEKEVSITIAKEQIVLQGILNIPEKAQGIVVFAHGSGSGRFSPRNQFVAHTLNKDHIGTLLLDLLTPDEEKIDEYTREYRFNIPLLAGRLVGVSHWLAQEPETRPLKVAYFGSSTGAAAALIAAADGGKKISAVVSRGGRPDLAKAVLHKVLAPTLLLVGSNDYDVIELNKFAFGLLTCAKEMTLVPGATHLFEEPGTLEEAARLAAHWFKRHFKA